MSRTLKRLTVKNTGKYKFNSISSTSELRFYRSGSSFPVQITPQSHSKVTPIANNNPQIIVSFSSTIGTGTYQYSGQFSPIGTTHFDVWNLVSGTTKTTYKTIYTNIYNSSQPSWNMYSYWVALDNTQAGDWNTQVESAVCDGDGLNIVNTYYKKSTATSSGGTKVSRAAETGNWSDLINKPTLYEHLFRLKDAATATRTIVFNTILKRESAFTSISTMFTYFGGTTPAAPTPANRDTYSSVRIPIRYSTGVSIYPTYDGPEYLGEILIWCDIWCHRKYKTTRPFYTTTYYIKINTPIIDSGAWDDLGDTEFKTIDFDHVYEV